MNEMIPMRASDRTVQHLMKDLNWDESTHSNAQNKQGKTESSHSGPTSEQTTSWKHNSELHE